MCLLHTLQLHFSPEMGMNKCKSKGNCSNAGMEGRCIAGVNIASTSRCGGHVLGTTAAQHSLRRASTCRAAALKLIRDAGLLNTRFVNVRVVCIAIGDSRALVGCVAGRHSGQLVRAEFEERARVVFRIFLVIIGDAGVRVGSIVVSRRTAPALTNGLHGRRAVGAARRGFVQHSVLLAAGLIRVTVRNVAVLLKKTFVCSPAGRCGRELVSAERKQRSDTCQLHYCESNEKHGVSTAAHLGYLLY
mmetsp:Transcript_4475/g.10713  ORF Transcript_4475/g.10713 Transcript_4475/m.10713 type:complete len:246 (-) Transcript_4475:53-790(-)